MGIVAIPRSSSEDHIRENFASLEVVLTDDELEQISNLDRGDRIVSPDFAPF
ncbi:MAG: 2,5-diketo-D-gluconate reductase B [candidate division WS6 bacterium OLB20]|uniref:2,5-diketo-D-gluconate reductase B n=1 Tax=candidate division WS6 bacterium OLB20 TaxID=1617426 RepID=A0A136M187_9BACT|nr:MAG: 2,5-diketo-D-gluconate reductase B [candidate division WS6 bacterium OLB20]